MTLGWALLMILIMLGCGEPQTAPLETDRSRGFGPGPTGGINPSQGVALLDDDADIGSDLDAASSETADAGLPDAQPDVARFEIVPYAVETRVGQRRTPAGLENRITCQVLDQVGEPIVDLQSQAEIYPDNGFERFEREEITGLDDPPDRLGGVPAFGGGLGSDGAGGQPNGGGVPALPAVDPEGDPDASPRVVTGAIGFIARDYEVACTAPALGLRDPSPA
ncbi:MAG: hypothetical protein VX589_00890, partial [Myxococcota bacterium]|nr:hypothetical protein [Myxococcota bacterium]